MINLAVHCPLLERTDKQREAGKGDYYGHCCNVSTGRIW